MYLSKISKYLLEMLHIAIVLLYLKKHAEHLIFLILCSLAPIFIASVTGSAFQPS